MFGVNFVKLGGQISLGIGLFILILALVPNWIVGLLMMLSGLLLLWGSKNK